MAIHPHPPVIIFLLLRIFLYLCANHMLIADRWAIIEIILLRNFPEQE
jgi:hypothetical protein